MRSDVRLMIEDLGSQFVNDVAIVPVPQGRYLLRNGISISVEYSKDWAIWDLI